MVLTINQIIKLIEIVDQHKKNNKSDREQVKKDFDFKPISYGYDFADYVGIEKFCQVTEIAIYNDNEISLTELGDILLENKTSEKQLKELILQKCFSKNNFSKKIIQTLSKFHYDKTEGLWFNKNIVVNLFQSSKYLPLFYDVELLVKDQNVIRVNPKYCDYNKIIKYKTKTYKLSQERLLEKLENQKLIGEIAEEIVLDFEKTRLKNEGSLSFSELVRQINIDFSNAGYDLESFTGIVIDGLYNRFIEVKGSTGNILDFHWSLNEIKIAEERKEEYWIYFVSNIDVKSRSSPNEPLMIPNPWKNIFLDDTYAKDPENYHVYKKLPDL